MSTFMQKAALLGSFAASVYAHGRIDSITIDGQEYSGYTSSMAYSTNNDPIIAWSADNGDNGFVGPESYTSPDIACHKVCFIKTFSALRHPLTSNSER